MPHLAPGAPFITPNFIARLIVDDTVFCAAGRLARAAVMDDTLSPIDIRILEQIQRDSSLSSSELADKVGISQSPCWRRLQRLRD